jgi:hypothetical protein
LYVRLPLLHIVHGGLAQHHLVYQLVTDIHTEYHNRERSDGDFIRS